jgi:lambda repressor-like predicted transcriptional regulator
MNTNALPRRLIKANLAIRGKTMASLAGELGMSRQGLHQVVTGLRKTEKRRLQIAEATGLRVEDLWPGEAA